VIKLVTFLKRRDGLTRPAFEARWRDVHAPLAAIFPGLRGYMLSFPILPDPEEPSADGVAQLWFDSAEACQASYASEIGRSGSKDAAANLRRRQHLFASEDWIRPPRSLAPYPCKLLIAAKRRPDLDRAAFVAAWDAASRRVAARITPDLPSRVCSDRCGKILNSAPDGALGLIDAEPVHDGLFEIWTADAAALSQVMARLSPRPDEFAGLVQEVEILALREHVIVLPQAPAYGVA